MSYYTVIIPYSYEPTKWHPTDRASGPLARGAFATKAEAHKWAFDNLNGQDYTVGLWSEAE